VACSTAAGGRASDFQTRLRSPATVGGGRTLFIWIGANIVNTDSTVGLTPFYRINNFELNILILNNNQPIICVLTWNIMPIHIISKLIFLRVDLAFLRSI
ncbi:MAG: hypothetical protein JW925_00785, partial [Syntrophaceae bacterium]|nr:hypothetical protein [Syntrophaceae bacterium]